MLFINRTPYIQQTKISAMNLVFSIVIKSKQVIFVAIYQTAPSAREKVANNAIITNHTVCYLEQINIILCFEEHLIKILTTP